MTAAEALNTVTLNVNNLIYILKDPLNSKLRSGITYIDLTNSENERVAKYINEASQALNRIALDFYMISPSLNTSSLNKSVSESKTVSPFKEDYAMLNILSDNNSELPSEVEPAVENECIAIGRAFENLDDALKIFQEYAIKSGFNICKGNSKKDVYQEYACSARGKARKRNNGVNKRNRKSIKNMCKCHIILRKRDDNWIITTRKLEHTHQLLTESQIKMTAKNRFIPDHIKFRAISFYSAGESPARIQYLLEQEYNDMCTWSMKDLYNMLYRYRDSIKLEESAF